ncbi:hypothetical protein SLS55_005997 [Diplodia seriata]|uniref:AMP-dependent synthetase/ligase domain-containing protein n=1 Tax=Diplodia seriata TaxID=420778 RepID=A0ABR3CD32_9PEZI
MRFSRILANILRDLYGIRPPSTSDRYRLAAKYNDALNNWRASVAYLLDTDGVDPSLFLPIFLRQRNVLNLAFWHAQILVHRPFLLSNFAGLSSYNNLHHHHRPNGRDSSSDGGGGGGKLAYHVQCCLDAATNIVRVVDELTRSGQIYSTFWFTHYFAFCAVVVLYVHTIQQQQRRLPPPSTTTDNEQPSSHYRAASRCHDQISRIATKGSLAERYGVVLQELRMELLRHGSVDGGGGDVGGVQRQQQEIDVGMAVPVVAPPPVLAQPVFQQQQQDGLGLDGLQQQQGIEAFAEASPSSSIAAQMTGWGQFDSLPIMLVSTTSAPSSLDAPNASKVSKQPDQINSINDLLLHKAETIPNTPLIAYPASEHSSNDLADYTAKDLDAFVDEAAKEYTRLGLLPKESRSTSSEVVALLGPSNLDYVITLLALSRMGFAVLFLSTRLPTEAYVSLLQKTHCSKIVASPRFASTIVPDIQRASSDAGADALSSFAQLDSSVYTRRASSGGARFARQTELVDEEACVAFIVHSSGSTGLPKPIFQTHRACLSNYALGSGMRAFVTLPLFHNHGLATTFRGIVSGKRTVLFNAALPLTNAHLVAAMRAAEAESFHCVPYALKVLAETDEGVEQLRRCRLVLFGGSSCPDELGDELVRRGVYIVGHYGA